MRKWIVAALLVAFLATGFLGGRLLSQGKSGAGPTSEALSTLEQGLTSLQAEVQTALSTSNTLQQAVEQLGGRLERLENNAALQDFQTLADQVNRLAQRVEEVSLPPTTDEAPHLQTLTQQLAELEGEVRQQQEQINGINSAPSSPPAPAPLRIGLVDQSRLRQRFPQFSTEDYQTILQKVGAANQFDLILDLSSSSYYSGVLYAREGALVDLTEQILVLMGNTYRGLPR